MLWRHKITHVNSAFDENDPIQFPLCDHVVLMADLAAMWSLMFLHGYFPLFLAGVV